MIRVPLKSKKQIVALALATLAMTEVAFYESTLVGTNASLLLALKLVAPLCLIIAIAWAWHRPDSFALKIFVGAVFIYYPAVSALFRPWYVFAVLQLMLIYAFFFDVRPKLYWPYAACAIFAFYIPFWLRWPNVPENSVRLGFGDWVSISIQQFAILALTYVFVVRSRNFERRTQASLLAIGRHAARVTHDLKGMLSAPLLYLDHAKTVLSQQPGVSLALLESVAQTQRELGDLHLAVSELSRLTTTEALPITVFSFAECLHSTALLFRSELQRRGYEVDESFRLQRWMIEADRSQVATIVFELFSLALTVRTSMSTGRIRSLLVSETESFDLLIEPVDDSHLGNVDETLARIQSLAAQTGTQLLKTQTARTLEFKWRLTGVLQNRREI